MYQFPMGKVKRSLEKKAIRDYVSIPYGKGKGSRPVRHRTTLPGVSIPYGKGKVLTLMEILCSMNGINSLWER